MADEMNRTELENYGYGAEGRPPYGYAAGAPQGYGSAPYASPYGYAPPYPPYGPPPRAYYRGATERARTTLARTALATPRGRGVISELDVYRAANLLIDRHGGDALVAAAQMIDRMLELGDPEGRQVWRRIKAAIKQLQTPPHFDEGYRGHNHKEKFRVWISGEVRWVTTPIRREMRRRAAVEPVIGHTMAEHRMGRNYRDGDRINAVLAAAG
jgi:hypothetical protein